MKGSPRKRKASPPPPKTPTRRLRSTVDRSPVDPSGKLPAAAPVNDDHHPATPGLLPFPQARARGTIPPPSPPTATAEAASGHVDALKSKPLADPDLNLDPRLRPGPSRAPTARSNALAPIAPIGAHATRSTTTGHQLLGPLAKPRRSKTTAAVPPSSPLLPATLPAARPTSPLVLATLPSSLLPLPGNPRTALGVLHEDAPGLEMADGAAGAKIPESPPARLERVETPAASGAGQNTVEASISDGEEEDEAMGSRSASSSEYLPGVRELAERQRRPRSGPELEPETHAAPPTRPDPILYNDASQKIVLKLTNHLRNFGVAPSASRSRHRRMPMETDIVRPVVESAKVLRQMYIDHKGSDLRQVDECAADTERRIAVMGEDIAKIDGNTTEETPESDSEVRDMIVHGFRDLGRLIIAAYACLKNGEGQTVTRPKQLIDIIDLALDLDAKIKERNVALRGEHVFRPWKSAGASLRAWRKTIDNALEKRKRRLQQDAALLQNTFSVAQQRSINDDGDAGQTIPVRDDGGSRDEVDHADDDGRQPMPSNGDGVRLPQHDDDGMADERVRAPPSPAPSPRLPRPWEDAELMTLVLSLEQFQGDDRFSRILQVRGGPGQVLGSRNFDELVQKAAEYKSDYLTDIDVRPLQCRSAPPWLMSVVNEAGS
ncbi:MAG: hypothetical protein M1826_003446 [Phylliscum demangeonii]|nr:MAG: hypothetical protein M1826_003446 [Phylliscum demangeonii]